MVLHRKLTDDEVASRMSCMTGWEVADGKLHRELRFRDFGAAFGFMTSVALAAEASDHHPEWSNVYNRVVIDLSTHDVGGISAKDFDLAAVIDRFAGQS